MHRLKEGPSQYELLTWTTLVGVSLTVLFNSGLIYLKTRDLSKSDLHNMFVEEYHSLTRGDFWECGVTKEPQVASKQLKD